MACGVRSWYEATVLGVDCNAETHCIDAEPNGNCDQCDTIDGRWIGAVAEYASTCDCCGELHMNDSQTFDPETNIGYCEEC